ncbi:hypothetical protein A33K_16381 [Burkholderia humptydooensis MSMB43]|uniref:Uncharacterized protein n=1 Tax=Burkholderia humptydooensis MSMB43 TaxID=441157 RepID=A0ABN0G390_9BURK|nr:hypothetical protein A33K_16381 [Burkholderia humptydooensis MSMB43]
MPCLVNARADAVSGALTGVPSAARRSGGKRRHARSGPSSDEAHSRIHVESAAESA